MNNKHMRGTYVVEFAFVGLLVFTLLFGVLEMGRLYFTVNALDEAARRGARPGGGGATSATRWCCAGPSSTPQRTPGPVN